MTCPVKSTLIESEINRVATQYRESPHLLALMRTMLGEVADALLAICEIPSFFDLDSSTGDQLTLLGKMLGWPRCHCICETTPVFGFNCGGSGQFEIVGFCEGGTWVDCGAVGAGEICLDDDEIYRLFLKVRIYQILGLYDIESLTECVRLMWGDAANIVNVGRGQVVLAPGRALTSFEARLVSLVFRVMPIAPGIKGLIHYGGDIPVGAPVISGPALTIDTTPTITGTGALPGATIEIWIDEDPDESSATYVGPVFGFGAGWGGLCESEWLCPEDPYTYECA